MTPSKSIYLSNGPTEPIYYSKGPHRVSLIRRLIMLTSQTKNEITVIREADQIAQMAFCFLTAAYLLKAVRSPDSRPLDT